jgi:hypothetical protein
MSSSQNRYVSCPFLPFFRFQFSQTGTAAALALQTSSHRHILRHSGGHILYLPMIIKLYVKMSFFYVFYEVQRYSHNISTETGVLKTMQYIRSFSAI